MLQLLIKDGLLEGNHAIGPLDTCPLGGCEACLFKLGLANIQPRRSPMQLSPSPRSIIFIQCIWTTFYAIETALQYG